MKLIFLINCKDVESIQLNPSFSVTNIGKPNEMICDIRHDMSLNVIIWYMFNMTYDLMSSNPILLHCITLMNNCYVASIFKTGLISINRNSIGVNLFYLPWIEEDLRSPEYKTFNIGFVKRLILFIDVMNFIGIILILGSRYFHPQFLYMVNYIYTTFFYW